MQPLPAGIPGEMYVGGAGVARGYLNRPELTKERFIKIETGEFSGMRLYKSGDLARYLSDGDVEYLGRIDHQVKLRGFRVELGEIESVLAGHPDIRENVVIIHEDESGARQLAAYVVFKKEPAPSVKALREFLRQKLPDYMVPAAFVPMDALPLTPNGKTDRRTLPRPDLLRKRPEEGFVPPCTTTEKLLTDIWAKVLKLDRVGIHDNFFELGGDSILSMTIRTIAGQVGIQLTPRQIFEHQTVSKLAEVVTETAASVRAEQEVITGPLPLTSAQYYVFEHSMPECHHFNMSVLIDAPQNLEPNEFEEIIRQLLLHHDALRLRFKSLSDNWRDWEQINAEPDETVPFTVTDLSGLSPEDQETAAESEIARLRKGLNLSEGPVTQAGLLFFGSDKPDRLVIVMHYLSADSMSCRILLEDFFTACGQVGRGEPIQLPLKTTAYKDWAYRLAEYVKSESLAAESDYWLSDVRSHIPSLPVDYPSGKSANTVLSTGCVLNSLGVEDTHALLYDIPGIYNSQINDVLLAALLQTLNRYSGELALLVDLEAHGREELFPDTDLSRTAGCFTIVFPVLLKLETDSHPGNIVKSVKEQLRSIPQRGIGYSLLRYMSRDETIRRRLEAMPQAEISFNYMGQFDQYLFEFTRSQQGNRFHLLEVDGFVAEDRLQMSWRYSENIHKRATVVHLAESFMEVLKSFITNRQS
ncbi:condensation domain-containing protein [Desulfonema magnum]|uniref:Condensation domain-containing protein n=1 Tax=Desulfonema magnum TaxID=45655 RepID=A0A975BQE6_9BACT|nr:condensation domain-containing protein [Desulfonema magnum]QTA89155.1 Condensation domain-containing protein [Desulfonema magnum]